MTAATCADSRAENAGLTLALRLARAGLPIFPAAVTYDPAANSWTKTPLIKGWRFHATCDGADVRQLWARYPHAVPGIELGRAGLVVIDGDRHGGPDGVAALRPLVDRAPPHPITLTAGGGEHHVFRQPDGEPLGNGRGSLPDGIDVRGRGGWIVAPGAFRRDGAGWIAAPGTPDLAEAFATGAIPVLPDPLVRIIRTPRFHANGSERPNFGDTGPSGDAGARERAYAREALDRNARELADARKPGRNDALNAIAYRMGRMVGAGWIGRAEVGEALWRACETNGLLGEDGPARVRATLESGLLKGEANPHPGLGERAGGSRGSGRAGSDAKQESPGATADSDHDWTSPDLSFLGTGRRPAPAFPTDLLGPFWADWCERTAKAASAPIDYVAVSLLAVAAAAIANVRWPLAGAAWSEPPLLWCALVGSPSSGKSPAMEQTLSLVRRAEECMAEGFDDQVREFETRKQTAKAAREAWEQVVKDAVKGGMTPPTLPPEAEVPDQPVRPRIRVADATVEALGHLAAALPRGLLLVRDELAGWFGSFDKYGGRGADRAFAVEMYGGRPYVIDRVKSPEPIRIRHLSVGVLGSVQPEKVSGIVEGPDDGLASRLLWSWPECLPTFALARETEEDAAAQAAFARLTGLRLGADQFGNPEPIRAPLSPEAEDILEAFAREMAERANEASGIFAGALGKARGHALRLAAVLEHLRWTASPSAAEPITISARATAAAAGLVAGYFIPMAERVFGDAAIPTADRAAMTLARHLRKRGCREFNARDMRREIGGDLRDTRMMDATCDLLCEAGLIRPKQRPEGTGRPPKNFEVNPALHGARP